MSHSFVAAIRLDGSEYFLVNQSDKFVRTSSQTLMEFQTLKDARAIYPNAGGPGRVSDLDATLTWCLKRQPKPVESVDQSDRFWDVIEFLELVEEDGLLDAEALQAFRMADDVAAMFFWATAHTIMTAANPSIGECAKLQAMFELGIAALRRVLPERLTNGSLQLGD